MTKTQEIILKSELPIRYLLLKALIDERIKQELSFFDDKGLAEYRKKTSLLQVKLNKLTTEMTDILLND